MRSAFTLTAVSWLVIALISSADAPKAAAVTPEQAEFFERRVRPILVEQCQRCHGTKKAMSGLRLDSAAALHKGGDNGPVVKAGDPDGSSLIQAVRHADKLKMPPKDKLKPEAIEALTAWVKMGVPWPEAKATTDNAAEAAKRHWAFQPVQNPTPPATNDGWARTAVDRFIVARLAAKGLTPAPQAEPRVLIRRLYFDLIGLPPSAAEVEEFCAAAARDPQAALEKLLDRLLASPHYGERWGRHWLDVARYADTKGYVFFEDATYPWAYTYRDYVVEAFNADLPYDQFIVQQLAADQLPRGADQRSLRALGLVTAGGRFMSNPHDIIDDRIDVVMRGLQGLTVTCARCHDHKFDPIPSKDYYSLYGVFASSLEPIIPPLFAEPAHTPRYAAFEEELAERQQKLADFLRQKYAELVASTRKRAGEYLLAAHVHRDQPATDDFMLLADGNDLNPTMIRLWQTYLARTRKNHNSVFAPWHALLALPEKEFADGAANLVAKLATAGDRAVNPLIVRALTERPPKTLAEASQRYGKALNTVEPLWQDALRRAQAAGLPAPLRLDDPAQEELRQVLYAPDSPPSVPFNLLGELALLPDRPAQGRLQQLRGSVMKWVISGTAAPPRAMALEDAPLPYSPRVFLRGNPTNLGEPVPRQFVSVLAGAERKPFAHGSGRLELARAIADPKNPLTARVMVNRIWLHHFGAALVRTPGDFGLRSEAPSHPELLDFLATYFMADGGPNAPAWSIKKLHRLIVLSAVYQQQSNDRGDCQAVDPENILLWKMNRRRLDFESTRDVLLAVSGRLDRSVGGPPVGDMFSANANRRTLYGFIDRLNLPGLFRTFDFPNPDATSPQRDTTTIAPQALFFMNNPFVIEAARRVLQRPEIAAEKDPAARIERLYLLLFGRKPAAAELTLAQEFLTGSSAVGWERYVQALLETNELVFMD